MPPTSPIKPKPRGAPTEAATVEAVEPEPSREESAADVYARAAMQKSSPRGAQPAVVRPVEPVTVETIVGLSAALDSGKLELDAASLERVVDWAADPNAKLAIEALIAKHELGELRDAFSGDLE